MKTTDSIKLLIVGTFIKRNGLENQCWTVTTSSWLDLNLEYQCKLKIHQTSKQKLVLGYNILHWHKHSKMEMLQFRDSCSLYSCGEVKVTYHYSRISYSRSDFLVQSIDLDHRTSCSFWVFLSRVSSQHSPIQFWG